MWFWGCDRKKCNLTVSTGKIYLQFSEKIRLGSSGRKYKFVVLAWKRGFAVFLGEIQFLVGGKIWLFKFWGKCDICDRKCDICDRKCNFIILAKKFIYIIIIYLS